MGDGKSRRTHDLVATHWPATSVVTPELARNNKA